MALQLSELMVPISTHVAPSTVPGAGPFTPNPPPYFVHFEESAATLLHSRLDTDPATHLAAPPTPSHFLVPPLPPLPPTLLASLRRLRDLAAPLHALPLPPHLCAHAEPDWPCLPSACHEALQAASLAPSTLPSTVSLELSSVCRAAVSRSLALRSWASLCTGKPRALWAAAVRAGAIDSPPLPPPQRLLATLGGGWDCGPLSSISAASAEHERLWVAAGLHSSCRPGPFTEDAANLVRSVALVLQLRRAMGAEDWLGAARALKKGLGEEGGTATAAAPAESGARCLHSPPNSCASFLAAALRCAARGGVSAAAREEVAAASLCVDRQRLLVDAEQYREGGGVTEAKYAALMCARSVEACVSILSEGGGAGHPPPPDGVGEPAAFPAVLWGAPLRAWLLRVSAAHHMHCLLEEVVVTRVRGCVGALDPPPLDPLALSAALSGFEKRIDATQVALSRAGEDCCGPMRPFWLLHSIRASVLADGGGALDALNGGEGLGGGVGSLQCLLRDAVAGNEELSAIVKALSGSVCGEGWGGGGSMGGDTGAVTLAEMISQPGAVEVGIIFSAAATHTAMRGLCKAVLAVGDIPPLSAALTVARTVVDVLPEQLAIALHARDDDAALFRPPPSLSSLAVLCTTLLAVRFGGAGKGGGVRGALLNAAREGILVLSDGGKCVSLPLSSASTLPLDVAASLCKELSDYGRLEAEAHGDAVLQASLLNGAPSTSASWLALWPLGSSSAAYAAGLRQALRATTGGGEGSATAALVSSVAEAAEAVSMGDWEARCFSREAARVSLAMHSSTPFSALYRHALHVGAISTLVGVLEAGSGSVQGEPGALLLHRVDSMPLLRAVRMLREKSGGVFSPLCGALVDQVMALAELRARVIEGSLLSGAECTSAAAALLRGRGALPPSLEELDLSPSLLREVALIAADAGACAADDALEAAMESGGGSF